MTATEHNVVVGIWLVMVGLVDQVGLHLNLLALGAGCFAAAALRWAFRHRPHFPYRLRIERVRPNQEHRACAAFCAPTVRGVG